MVLQSNVEVEGVSPISKAQTDKSVTAYDENIDVKDFVSHT